MNKFKLLQLNGDGNYVVIYNRGGWFFTNWRYVETYSTISASSYTIRIMTAAAGSPSMITAFQELIEYLKIELELQSKDTENKIHKKTVLGKWKTIEELEETMNNLPMGS